MADCDLCGKKAGLFRRRHEECLKIHERGAAEIIEIIAQAATSAGPMESLLSRVEGVASKSYIASRNLPELMVKGWESAVDRALDDDLLTTEEEVSLGRLAEVVGLSRELLDASGARTKLVKACVIRELLADKLPHRVKISGTLPFNLQKTEDIVWLFNDVSYYEERTTTTYSGGYQGISLRVAKGVYYRTGGFRGHPTPVTKTVQVDNGVLAATGRHLYFAGKSKSFRVPYSKIVTFTPYQDGIGIHRDAMTAKPQLLITGDGWFTFNLVTNLARIAAS